MKKSATFTDEDIRIQCSLDRDIVMSWLIVIISISIVVLLAFLFGEFFDHSNINIPIFIMSFGFGVILWDRLVWKLNGNRDIEIDQKYMIIFNKVGPFATSKVYRMSEVHDVMAKEYRRTLFDRFKLFWNKDADSGISFVYNDRKVNLGANLSVEESCEVVETIKKMQHDSD